MPRISVLSYGRYAAFPHLGSSYIYLTRGGTGEGHVDEHTGRASAHHACQESDALQRLITGSAFYVLCHSAAISVALS